MDMKYRSNARTKKVFTLVVVVRDGNSKRLDKELLPVKVNKFRGIHLMSKEIRLFLVFTRTSGYFKEGYLEVNVQVFIKLITNAIETLMHYMQMDTQRV